MLTRGLVRLIAGGLMVSGMCAVLVQAQGTTGAQAPSLGESARRIREEQGKSRPPAKVITNEDIGNLKGSISVVGTAATAPAAETDKAPAAGASEAATKSAAPEVKDEAYWRKRFAEARKVLADDQKELDILQREFNLKQEQFYQDPNAAMREQYTRGDLNKTQDTINTKKADVQKDQDAIRSLEDELRKAGGDAGWAREK
jgi:chromosome segregation ATPase